MGFRAATGAVPETPVPGSANAAAWNLPGGCGGVIGHSGRDI